MSAKFRLPLRLAALATLIVMVAATTPAWGQGAVTTGTIVGDVTDASGAVLPAAKITAQKQGTGLRRETVTDANGHFVISQLPAGRYEISATAAGFKASVVRDFQLNVDATVNLKFSLTLGSVEQKVDVNAEAAQVAVELSKTEVSNVIQEIQVRELPINQRSFTALVTQEPGLVTMTTASGYSSQSPTSVAFSQGSMISANGQVSQSMAYLIDGVNINNSGYGAPGTAAGGDIPGVEGIQEFKVLSQNYSAAYGGSAGAVVSFATRTGTNELHGSLYEFLRNDVVDAREYFNRPPFEKNPYRRNQFGATLGGPIKKDKTFFFTNYEALRSRLTTTGIANVPTVAARNGGGDGSDGRFRVEDPWGRPTEISPGVKALLTLYPLPNGQEFFNPDGSSAGVAEHIFANYQPINQHYGMVRIDHVLGSKDTLMARYSITDARGYNAHFVPTYQFDKASRMQGLAVKWSRTISNNLVNTLSAAFQRSLTLAAVNPTVPIPPLAYTANPVHKSVGGIAVGSGDIGQGAGGALTTIGTDPWGPFRGAHNTFPVNDDMIYIRGPHTVKFGGQVVPHQWNWDKGNMPAGNWLFPTLNDLLAGQPMFTGVLQDGALPHWKIRTNQIAWYVEDAWRLKPNLTLTLGLRHEFQAPVLSETHTPSRLGNFRSRDQVEPNIGEPFPNYTKKQFGPRVGIAYDPFKDGKTAIRAGFGVFYDFLPLETLAGQLTYNAPYPMLHNFVGVTAYPKGFRGTPDNPALPSLPFPACPPLPGDPSTTTCSYPGGYIGLTTEIWDPVRAPTSLQWNMQVERELPGGFKVSGTYTGSHTYNMARSFEGNSSKPCSYDANGQPYFGPLPGWCGTWASPQKQAIAFSLYVSTFDAHSFYHAGTAAVSRRLGSGVTFNSSYTFAKGISEADAINVGSVMVGTPGHSGDPLNRKYDRSESLFSIRHRFTMNGIFELPFGRGKLLGGNASGWKQALLGRWSLNPLIEIRSGYPFTVLDGVAASNMGDNVTQPDRPDMLRPNAVQGGINQYFDPKAFAMQEIGTLGNAPRNSVRGPGFTEIDLSLSKKFKPTEKTDLEFRAEAFNLINHPNFDLPFAKLYTPLTPTETDQSSCNLSDAQKLLYACNRQAGRITRTVGTPRQLQFALKFTF
ncbi:MAG: carboxypeptidase regulatory-like domain-containing protein [Terriglobales bacterium]